MFNPRFAIPASGAPKLIAFILLLAAGVALSPGAQPETFTPTGRYRCETIEGWTVRFHPDLVAETNLFARVHKAIAGRLDYITAVVPAGPLARLRAVPVWIEVSDPHHFGACFHESREWLTENGINPEKTGGIEISDARAFVNDWMRTEPMVVLHELAHAYHALHLGADHPGILRCYEAAKKSGSYESVLRISGHRERAYAITNPKDYFCELTEAYFGTNDYFPFVRAELKGHDPEMFKVLEQVWETGGLVK